MNPQIIKSVINTIVNEGVKEYLEVIGINIYTIHPKGTRFSGFGTQRTSKRNRNQI